MKHTVHYVPHTHYDAEVFLTRAETSEAFAYLKLEQAYTAAKKEFIANTGIQDRAIDKDNSNVPDFDIRFGAIFALGERGDPAAIEPLENLRKSGDIPSGEGPVIEQQIARIKNPERQNRETQSADNAASGARAANGGADRQIVDRLDKIEQNLTEMNERLKKIEQQQAKATP